MERCYNVNGSTDKKYWVDAGLELLRAEVLTVGAKRIKKTKRLMITPRCDYRTQSKVMSIAFVCVLLYSIIFASVKALLKIVWDA